jgi:hypothetical protein
MVSPFRAIESPGRQETIDRAIGEKGDAAYTREGLEASYPPVKIARVPDVTPGPSLETIVRGFVSDFQKIAEECQPPDRRDDPLLIRR